MPLKGIEELILLEKDKMQKKLSDLEVPFINEEKISSYGREFI